MEVFNILMTGFTCFLCLVLMMYQIYVNRKHAALVSFSTRLLPVCLLVIAVMSAIGFSSGEESMFLLPLNLIIGIFPVLLISSSFLPKRGLTIGLSLVFGILFNLVCIYFFRIERYRYTPVLYGICGAGAASCYIIYFLVSLWLYIWRIKNIVQKTTVWTMLVLSVDVVYIFFIFILAAILYTSTILSGHGAMLLAGISTFLLLMTLVALAYRISSDSLFFVMRRHETVILESMNDIPCNISGNRSVTDDVYKEIFDRIVDYFENDMPYLRGSLVIEDLVKVVYANKLYISRSISRCTGRNFCQFVNYYRVRHSVEVFRQNPEFKVAELAEHSGFNSVVSFTMAFKLYMNENPSDWIRQERSRLIKCRP